jgi:hypothetical protein
MHLHCPKTHEQFPSSFGNAEVISSDFFRRKLFINIKLFMNLQGNAIQLYHLFSMTIVQKKIKAAEKMAMRHFPHFIYKFMKLLMNFLWTLSQTSWKNWVCQYFQNYHEFFMNCFLNYLKKLGLSIFPKLPWTVSKTTWKFRPPQYFQVVLEIFPSSFGNVSCIENAFGTVYKSYFRKI